MQVMTGRRLLFMQRDIVNDFALCSNNRLISEIGVHISVANL